MVELWLWKTAWQKKMECWKHWWRKLLKVKGDTLLNWRDFLLQKLHSFGEALNLRGAIHGPLFPLLMVGRVVIQQDSIKSLPWATSIYLVATWKYQTNLCKKLGNCTRSKQWWSLLLSLVGRSPSGSSFSLLFFLWTVLLLNIRWTSNFRRIPSFNILRISN